MKKSVIVSAGLAAVLAFTSGCFVSSRSGQVYSRDQARQIHQVEEGTVKAVRPVTIEGSRTPVGAIAGGVLGGALGRNIGSGGGRDLATAAGAVGGAAAGAAAEQQLTKKKGLEITVELDSGRNVTVVQEADVQFSPGERVRVLTAGDGSARVTK
ncbi:glycine zipper 2TM domain-containing protein [Kiritimatiella glycovorans]|uniref:Outer membrane lipoprotein n=1 Tax=Kiritimatiella glycovorans TaxID=1307763 RepID=A0A0G3EHI9_9BACT|nr:glycine zipper 2TM domain-containing protein [Kiritimatiella glycovorans]AKJ64872.1 Outer membrane lipoprotein [Kiritimatiella glycovorans]